MGTEGEGFEPSERRVSYALHGISRAPSTTQPPLQGQRLITSAPTFWGL